MCKFNINSFLLAILLVICSLNFYEQQRTSRELRKMIEWQKARLEEYQQIMNSQYRDRQRTGISNGGYVVKPAPAYPASAREREEEGTVKVEVIVNEQGQVESTRVISSSGSPRLDRAAQNAAQKAQYHPKKIDGENVRTRFVAGYTFSLGE